MSSPTSDPCKPFENADGSVNLGQLIDTTLEVLECGVEEAKTLTGSMKNIILAHLVRGYVALIEARTAHERQQELNHPS